MSFTTRKSLLGRVKCGDEVSWQEFYDTYRPLIALVGRDCGLSASESDDLVQVVMTEIFRKGIVGKYDPDKVPADVVFQREEGGGRFRYFFKAIVRNQALKLCRRHRPETTLEGVAEPSVEADFEAAWDAQWREHVYRQACLELRERVQSETYAAFEMYAVQGRPPKDVAAFLGLSVDSVYVAKSRCTDILQEIVRGWEEER